jgi:GTP-dependent phosphoenolpyruvate carboxykinase
MKERRIGIVIKDEPNLDMAKFMSHELKDFFGNLINIGDKLAKPTIDFFCTQPYFTVCTVQWIDGDKLYISDNKREIKYPGRCINLTALMKKDSNGK